MCGFFNTICTIRKIYRHFSLTIFEIMMLKITGMSWSKRYIFKKDDI